MIRKTATAALLALLFTQYVHAAWTYDTHGGTFTPSAWTPNYTNFTWQWSGYSDVQVTNCTFAGAWTNIIFRMATPRSPALAYDVTNGTATVGATTTAYTVIIPYTNLPPAGTYNTEFLAYRTSATSGPARVLAAGKIQVHNSVWSSTDYTTAVNPLAGSTSNAPLAALEMDYTPTAALAGWGYDEHGGTFAVADWTPDYTNFVWNWSAYSDVQVTNCVFTGGEYNNIWLRLAYPKDGDVWLDVTNGSVTVTGGLTNSYVARVSRTQFPKAGSYFAEFLAFASATTGTPTRVLACGKVNIHASVYQNTDPADGAYAGMIGPPIHALTALTNWPFASSVTLTEGTNNAATLTEGVLAINVRTNYSVTGGGSGDSTNGVNASLTNHVATTLADGAHGGELDPKWAAVSNVVMAGAAAGATAVQPADTNGWETGSHAGFVTGAVLRVESQGLSDVLAINRNGGGAAITNVQSIRAGTGEAYGFYNLAENVIYDRVGGSDYRVLDLHFRRAYSFETPEKLMFDWSLTDRVDFQGSRIITTNTVEAAGGFVGPIAATNVTGATWLPLTGGTMSGPLNMGGQVVTNSAGFYGSFGSIDADAVINLAVRDRSGNLSILVGESHRFLFGTNSTTAIPFGSGYIPLASISGTGDLARVNWPASDGQEYVAKNGAWAVATGGGETNILEMQTAETDTDLVLKPDGAGGVAWGADATGGGGLTNGIATAYSGGSSSVVELASTAYTQEGLAALAATVDDSLVVPYALTSAATVTVTRAMGPEVRLMAAANLTIAFAAELLGTNDVAMVGFALHPNGKTITLNTNVIDRTTATSTLSGMVTNAWNDWIFRKGHGATKFKVRP